MGKRKAQLNSNPKTITFINKKRICPKSRYESRIETHRGNIKGWIEQRGDLDDVFIHITHLSSQIECLDTTFINWTHNHKC